MKIRWHERELESVQLYASKAKTLDRFLANGFDLYVSDERNVGCSAELWHPSGSFRAVSDTHDTTPQQAVDSLLKGFADVLRETVDQ